MIRSRILAVILAIGLMLVPLLTSACPRMVSQSPYITHTLQWLGFGDCLVGANRYDSLDLPRTGGVMDPDAQAISRLRPDLWFVSDWVSEDKIKTLTPSGTRAVRLHGFQRMSQIEDNIRLIGRAAGSPDADGRAKEFAAAWRAKAHAVKGQQKRAVLLSACNNSPYSYGKNTWLYDLFSEAEFKIVETHPEIRHIAPGQEIEDLGEFLRRFDPEVVFLIRPDGAEQCQAVFADFPVRVIPLDSALFSHPAPVLLKGLDALRRHTMEL